MAEVSNLNPEATQAHGEEENPGFFQDSSSRFLIGWR